MFAAGVIVALLGRGGRGGVFEVEDYTFAGVAPQEEDMENEEEAEEERWVGEKDYEREREREREEEMVWSVFQVCGAGLWSGTGFLLVRPAQHRDVC